MRDWILTGVVFGCAVIGSAQQRQTQAELWVRLQTPVSSAGRAAAVGDAVAATVVSPFADSATGLRIPPGAVVSGSFETADRGKLRLNFHTIRIGNSGYPMRARVSAVDNARETITADGTIVAMTPLRKRPGKVELLLLAAAHAHPATLAFIEGAKLTLREVERPSVHYAAGTDLALRLEVAPVLPVLRSADAPVAAAPPELSAALDALPLRTETYQGNKPSDWINLAFAAESSEALAAAFAAAGWSRAEQLSLAADVKTFFSLAAHHSYRHAPVSRLAVAGQLPDFVFQKQTNTFAKRHHIRIWQTDARWKGQPLWIGAATHDIDIDFSLGAKTFIHRVETEVDRERAKIVDDLKFAGAVDRVFHHARPQVPPESRNATGDTLRTDGALWMVQLGRSTRASPAASRPSFRVLQAGR